MTRLALASLTVVLVLFAGLSGAQPTNPGLSGVAPTAPRFGGAAWAQAVPVLPVPARTGALTDAGHMVTAEEIASLDWLLKAARYNDGIDILVLTRRAAGTPTRARMERIAQAWRLDDAGARPWALIVVSRQATAELLTSADVAAADQDRARAALRAAGPGVEGLKSALPAVVAALRRSGQPTAGSSVLGLIAPWILFAAFGGMIWLAVRQSRKR